MASHDPKPGYNIGINNIGNSRLNLQYYQIQETFNNEVLNPIITSALQPQKEHDPPLRIADLCCGTGVWLTQIARSPLIHASTELYAFEKNLAGLPPQEWYPRLNSQVYDIFEEPEKELQDTFDVVNVSLTLSFIRDDAFPKVLSNVLKLLRPGTGWLQWTELSSTMSFHSPKTGIVTESSLAKLLAGIYARLVSTPPTWNDRLYECFIDCQQVADVQVQNPDVQWETLKPWTESVLFLGAEDILSTFKAKMSNTDEDRAKTVELQKLHDSACKEFFEQGICTWQPRLRVVARRKE